MSAKKEFVVVYNPRSGGSFGRAVLQELFSQHAISVSDWVSVKQIDQALPAHAARGATIIAVGGDGTMSHVARIVYGTNAVLAPLPGGTLNHFTKDLGVAQTMNEAIAQLAHAEPRAIDVALVNGNIFVNNSSIGLYPSSLRLRGKLENRIGKWPAAFVASLRSLWQLRIYTVRVDNETFQAPFIFVGNNEYALDSVGTTTRTALDAGVLSVFIAKTPSRRMLVKIGLYALIGKAHLLNEFDVFTVQKITIEVNRPRLSVSYDGEVKRIVPPLTYEIKPKALRVLV